MSESILVKSGGGADLDVVTAIAADIVAPKVSVDKDGEPIIGTIIDRGNWNSSDLAAGASVTIPAGKHGGSGKVTAKSLASQTACTASDGYVYSGKTYWKDGTLRTGTMSVNSVLSFSAAAYGGKQILLKWQNPYAATGKPFSGVEIRYGTGGYPGTGGSVIYAGAGSNTAPGGWSQIIVTLPALDTTYYFSLRSYATCSAGTMYSGVSNASAATQAELWLTYTSNSIYTIPLGYTKLDAFAVGGGGNASVASRDRFGTGGGGGYTKQVNNVSVSSGDSIAIVVGSGQQYITNEPAGSSTVAKNSSIILTAGGGYCGEASSPVLMGKGGSGGGEGANTSAAQARAGDGGSNGANGGKNADGWQGGYGQGTTTRAWGTGTLYAGGGGGGNRYDGHIAGAGGAGGGGNGAGGGGNGSNGTAGTGGGGGGGSLNGRGGLGGSGIVLLHVY